MVDVTFLRIYYLFIVYKITYPDSLIHHRLAETVEAMSIVFD